MYFYTEIKMSLLIHERAKALDIEKNNYEIQMLPNHIDVWHRLIELASLARSIDASLPPNIRCFKLSETEDPLRTPFEVYLTDSTEEKFDQNAIDLSHSITLREALEQTLPEYIWQKELFFINSGTPLGFVSTIDAAIYTAFKEMEISLHTSGDMEVDPETDELFSVKTVYSEPVNVPIDYFMQNPSLAKQSFFLETKIASEDLDFRVIDTTRKRVQFIRQVLSSEFETTSDKYKEILVKSIEGLNGRYADKTFEQRHEQSWIAYCISKNKNASEWVKFLHETVGCDIRQQYGHNPNIDPLSVAIVQNDAKSVRYLLEQDFNINKPYVGFPEVLPEEQQKRWLRGCDDMVVKSIHWATIVGASDCVEVLLEHGANPNIQTERSMTAAHFAAMNEDISTLTHLAAYNADFEIENNERKVVSEMLPEGENADKIYDIIENWIDGSQPRPDKRADVSDKEDEIFISLPKVPNLDKLKEKENAVVNDKKISFNK